MKSINKIKRFAVYGLLAWLLFSFTVPLKSIYSIKLKDVNGEIIDLSKFKGKKIVFTTVTGSEADSSLGYLSAFCLKYKDSATFIGILSIEDGYNEKDKHTVKKRFKDYKKLDILLTDGMYTKKGSPNQSELMEWLTHKEQNRHFDNDVTGAGQKFFIDEAGELYAVMGPQTSSTNPVIQRIMSRPRRSASPASN